MKDWVDFEGETEHATAQTLPGRFYTSAAQFQSECETVLENGWHCLGRSDEIPETGDYLTAPFLTSR